MVSKKMSVKEAVQGAMTLVYEDFERFVKDIAKEHTIANMGQDLETLCHGYGQDPKYLIGSCFQQLREDCSCEEEEFVDGIDEEYRDWLKDAKRDAKRVRAAGLPLTIENSRLAFEKKGPFARPTGQKRGKR